jgi:gliding motility-associated-like protein
LPELEGPNGEGCLQRKNYFVPNTFTPNGDGVNDFFYPRGNNINRVQSMRIFNRWGEMIFEKRNFAANSQAMAGTGRIKEKLLHQTLMCTWLNLSVKTEVSFLSRVT